MHGLRWLLSRRGNRPFILQAEINVGFAMNNYGVRSMIGTLAGLLVGVVLALVINIAGGFSGILEFVIAGLMGTAGAQIGGSIARRLL